GTAWLEEIGFKVTNTHLYLMERTLERDGETRPIYEALRSLAAVLELADFLPWGSVEGVLDSILDHPTASHRWQARLYVFELTFGYSAFLHCGRLSPVGQLRPGRICGPVRERHLTCRTIC